MSNFLFRKKFINFLRYIYIHTHPTNTIYIYIYVYENCSTMLDKSLRKDIKKKSRRDGEIWKQMLNEMGTLNMK